MDEMRHVARLFRIPEPKSDEEVARWEAKVKCAKLNKLIGERWERIERSGISPYINNTVMDAVFRGKGDSTRFLTATKQWMDDKQTKNRYLALLGTVGRGKTVSCAYALSRQNGIYVQVRRLERIFMASFGDEVKEQLRILDTALLAVDDLSLETALEKFRATLIEIIDARQDGGKRTIITGNITRKQFDERYPDDRLHSRLSNCLFVGDKGDDMRKQNL